MPNYYIRTGTETSRLLQINQSRLPTSGLYRLHQLDTVITPKRKSPATSYTLLRTGSLTSSIARYPPVQLDRRPVMGNGASSRQGGLPAYDQRDIRSGVEEEQHDWQPEQAVASQPETLSLQSTRKSYTFIPANTGAFWLSMCHIFYCCQVSTWMGDPLWAGKPSRHITINHPGQLSLAIPPWVGAMSSVCGLQGEGLMWLIGPWYVCWLHRRQWIMQFCIISSCQSAATSKIVKRF